MDTLSDRIAFHWQNDGNLWTRSLDSVERFFNADVPESAKQNPDRPMIVVGAQLSRRHARAAIRQAWMEMRFDHPQIACTVKKSEMNYRVPTEMDIQFWLHDTLFFDHSSKTVQELLATFQPPQMGSLLVRTRSKEIIFQIPHVHADGLGAVRLLNLLIAALVRGPKIIQFGDEHRNLSKSVTDLLDRKEPTLDEICKARIIANNFLRGFPSLGLNVDETSTTQCQLQMERTLLSVSETLGICAKAKTSGFTITQLCHSAMLRTFQSWVDIAFPRYTGLFFISHRDKLPRCHDNESPVSLRLTALPGTLELKPGANIWQISGVLKDLYKSFSNDLQSAVIHKPMYESLGYAPTALRGYANVHLASMGVVHGGSGLIDFWVGTSTNSPDLVTYVWTFQDQLTFAICYNAFYHEEEDIRRFLQMMKQDLCSILEVPQISIDTSV